MAEAHELVLTRHGQSEWNLENRFTGWVDVGLSPRGIEEARRAGRTLKDSGYVFDRALTSVLGRCVHTLTLMLEELGASSIPIVQDWRLNERHYGALQGLNKSEMTEKHGAEQVHAWRRGYAVRPPALRETDMGEFLRDPRYGAVDVPAAESLADTCVRVLQWWELVAQPVISGGERVLVVGHGNSLRALVKHLDGISDSDITRLNIPTGVPLVYRLDESLKPLESFYLADENALRASISEVENQAGQEPPTDAAP